MSKIFGLVKKADKFGLSPNQAYKFKNAESIEIRKFDKFQMPSVKKLVIHDILLIHNCNFDKKSIEKLVYYVRFGREDSSHHIDYVEYYAQEFALSLPNLKKFKFDGGFVDAKNYFGESVEKVVCEWFSGSPSKNLKYIKAESVELKSNAHLNVIYCQKLKTKYNLTVENLYLSGNKNINTRNFIHVKNLYILNKYEYIKSKGEEFDNIKFIV